MGREYSPPYVLPSRPSRRLGRLWHWLTCVACKAGVMPHYLGLKDNRRITVQQLNDEWHRFNTRN